MFVIYEIMFWCFFYFIFLFLSFLRVFIFLLLKGRFSKFVFEMLCNFGMCLYISKVLLKFDFVMRDVLNYVYFLFIYFKYLKKMI